MRSEHFWYILSFIGKLAKIWNRYVDNVVDRKGNALRCERPKWARGKKIDGSREGRGEQCQIDGGSLKKIVMENYPCQSICTHVHLSTLYSLLNVYWGMGEVVIVVMVIKGIWADREEHRHIVRVLRRSRKRGTSNKCEMSSRGT